MDRFFKCDCGSHILQVGYEGATKDFDSEEIFMAIFKIYNDKGDRRLKYPKLMGDVAIFNNAAPKELDDFFDFMEKIIKSRKRAKKTYDHSESPYMKFLDKSIKNIKIRNKKEADKDKKRITKQRKK